MRVNRLLNFYSGILSAYCCIIPIANTEQEPGHGGMEIETNLQLI